MLKKKKLSFPIVSVIGKKVHVLVYTLWEECVSNHIAIMYSQPHLIIYLKIVNIVYILQNHMFIISENALKASKNLANEESFYMYFKNIRKIDGSHFLCQQNWKPKLRFRMIDMHNFPLLLTYYRTLCD